MKWTISSEASVYLATHYGLSTPAPIEPLAPPKGVSPPAKPPPNPPPPPSPPPPPKLPYPRIFLTSKTYSMDALNGISGADVICTTEAGGSPSKALLVDESGCSGQPCRRASVTPNVGDGQVDWPLMPSTTYYNIDFSAIIAKTSSNSLLPSSLNSVPLSSSCVNQATGIDKDWTTRSALTCGNWRVSGGSGRQGVGWICRNNLSTGEMLNGGSMACSMAIQIMCVISA